MNAWAWAVCVSVSVSTDLCDEVREGMRAEFVLSIKGLRWTRNGITWMG